MAKNKSGRVIAVFLVIAIVLLLTGTAMALFFQQLEMRQRVSVEERLAQSHGENEDLKKIVDKLNRQVFLLEDQNKAADERINGLLDELELEKGLREEMRAEVVALRATLEQESTGKKNLEDQLVRLKDDFQNKVKDVEDKLRAEVARATHLEVEMKALKETRIQPIPPPEDIAPVDTEPKSLTRATSPSEVVDLEQIVVIPDQIPEGRVLNVDTDAEFVIINLGRKDGILEGMFLSIYRGQDYLGDVKVSRVQKDMSAADLVPPFMSRLVRQNDQVVFK